MLKDKNNIEEFGTRGVSAESLLAGERAEKYRVQLERAEVFPSKNNWEYIIEFKMYTLAPLLMRKFFMAWLCEEKDRSDYHNLVLENMPVYLAEIRRDAALHAVYQDIETCPEAVLYLVDKSRLFDALCLRQLLSMGDNQMFVTDCLAAMQPEYTHDDLHEMHLLLDDLEHLPEIGEVRKTRTIFGSDLKYICPNGHSNNPREEFCGHCGLNIYGLDSEHIARIEAYRTRLRILQRLLDDASVQ